MKPSVSVGDVFAGLALLLSIFATFTTARFNRRQKSLIESQNLLNHKLLAQHDDQAEAERRAELGANFVKLGDSKWRLKIFNKGRAVARNVTLSFPEGNEFLIQADIDSKFPMEVLEPMQGVDLIAVAYMGSKSKQVITLHWADDYSESNEKTVYPTL